jgi:FkbM family methyltransferase
LRPGRGDREAFYETWIERLYVSHGERLAPGDTVIDVGANIGCFAIFAAQRVGPTGRVIACEPDPETCDRLEHNVQRSGLSDIVKVERLAVTARTGKVSLYPSDNALFSSIYEQVDNRTASQPCLEVDAITLADLFERHDIEHCNYLKLDCEGAEHGIIASLTFELAAKIGQLTAELHELPNRDQTALLHQLTTLRFHQVPSHLPAIVHFRRAS